MIIGGLVILLFSVIIFSGSDKTRCEQLWFERDRLMLNDPDQIGAIRSNEEMLEKCGCIMKSY